MKPYRVIFPDTDIEKAVSVSQGRHYFNLEGTILACYDPIADGDEVTAKWVFHENQYIYIATPNLDKIFEKAKNSDCVSIDQKICNMPGSERLYYANDPCGNPMCFVEKSTVLTGE